MLGRPRWWEPRLLGQLLPRNDRLDAAQAFADGAEWTKALRDSVWPPSDSTTSRGPGSLRLPSWTSCGGTRAPRLVVGVSGSGFAHWPALVRLPHAKRGFVLLPKRWVVEITQPHYLSQQS